MVPHDACTIFCPFYSERLDSRFCCTYHIPLRLLGILCLLVHVLCTQVVAPSWPCDLLSLLGEFFSPFEPRKMNSRHSNDEMTLEE